MSWVSKHIEDLSKGMAVIAKPSGNSMQPLIFSKDEVFILPANEFTIHMGDVVLCRVKGKDLLHSVSAIKGDSYQISNYKGFINGWTKTIYGVVLCVVKGKGKYVRRV